MFCAKETSLHMRSPQCSSFLFGWRPILGPYGPCILSVSQSVNQSLNHPMLPCMQAQSMVMDTLGLASCVALTWAVRNHPRAKFALPLVVLPVCGLGDLTAIYAELKSVHLRIMNRERAELICEDWLGSGRIPSAQQVWLSVKPRGAWMIDAVTPSPAA